MLNAGSRVGPFEITGKLGQGGMGEVWRARDTRLDRDVALKFVPEDFASDPDRHARFEREAKVLAALNHPHIATLFGFEHAEGRHVLVMEYVEGEDLAQRLARGAIPVEEAVPIALQVAEALEAAHEKGIVHRDLKPANVKVRPDGTVKVLDFGLAKAWESDGGEGNLSLSPTITAHQTRAGVILGTAAYMSPEQARGKPVDKRADIWAFGCLVYEMLAGRGAFTGETVTDLLAAVVRVDPDWDALPSELPAGSRQVLSRCLEKDPKRRFRDIGDVRLELDGSMRGTVGAGPAPPQATGSARPAAGPRRRLALQLVAAAAAVIALAATVTLLVSRAGRQRVLPTFRRLTFQPGYLHSARFAPDGQTVVYGAAFAGSPVSLFTTRVDAMESRPIDLPGADVVGIARNGDMAILLGRHNVGGWLRVGDLAQASLVGGSPRAILDGVFDADIAPDGQSFAVVRGTGSEEQLEYPVGHVLARSQGWISLPRISRDGRRVAFAEHPFRGDDQGYVAVAEPDGTVTRVTGILNYLQGLCWAPDGTAVWATAGDDQIGIDLWAGAPGRAPRDLARFPGAVRILDASPGGLALIAVDNMRADLVGRLAGDDREKLYSSWSDDSLGGISADGTILTGDAGSVMVNGEYVGFFRRAGGSPAVRLGLGAGAGVTPDGRWVVSITQRTSRTAFTMYPTGAGQPRTLDLHGVEPMALGTARASFSADGRLMSFVGREPGGPAHAYVIDLGGGAPRAVTPGGVERPVLSPDGELLAALDPAGEILLYPVSGGQSRAVVATRPGEVPIEWDVSGRALFVWDQKVPVHVDRLDLASGARETVLTPTPEDPSGILYADLAMTRDARHYVVRYRRVRSDLAVVQGLP